MREKEKRKEIYRESSRREEGVEVVMTWEPNRVAMNELPNSG